MIIGITGNLGSGKSTVAEMFRRLGAFTIDADKICHSLMKPGAKVYKNVVKGFGPGILKKNKEINRALLAQIVFTDKAKLNTLNRLVHPEAIRKILDISKKNRKKVIIVDAPLLIESQLYKKMDRVIVVKAKSRKRDSLERIRMQASLKKKLALADFIIDNSGPRRETFSQVKKIWKQMGA